MTTIYFAQTDNTGDLVRYFTDRQEAVAWVEDHRTSEGYVASFNLGELTTQTVVDLLNNVERDSEAVYEVAA
jgi:hypothetical protein